MTGSKHTIWAVVPAAGIGSRMQAEVPKQYLELLGKPILQRTLERLGQSLPFERIVVALNPDDPYWSQRIDVNGLPVETVAGGAERCDSVLNALNSLKDIAQPDDWVLVHDAARPCVRPADLSHMLQVLSECGHGGILAAPVKDTMKRGDGDDCVAATVEREQLWHALTPQVFPFAELYQALDQALAAGDKITDEAMAIERVGGKVKLVPGAQDNIKVTRPEDLQLAALYLQAQQG